MQVVEVLAALYGLVVAYACLYLAGQWIAERLDR